jgi:hypothetical protein
LGVSFTSWLHFPCEKDPWYPLNTLEWAPEPVWMVWRSEHSRPYQDLHASLSVVQPVAAIPTPLLQLQLILYIRFIDFLFVSRVRHTYLWFCCRGYFIWFLVNCGLLKGIIEPFQFTRREGCRNALKYKYIFHTVKYSHAGYKYICLYTALRTDRPSVECEARYVPYQFWLERWSEGFKVLSGRTNPFPAYNFQFPKLIRFWIPLEVDA